MKNLIKTMMLLPVTILIFTTCNKDDESGSINPGEKAVINNLVLNPATGIKYGDAVSLTGVLTDDVALKSYTVTVSNASGTIFEKTQMLTGKTFNMNESVVIPLYPNATAADLAINITVKDIGNQPTSEDLSIKNVTLPDFERLYMVLNGTVYEMAKKGNTFTYEDFVPAGAKGKIYANANKTGVFWGWENGAVKVMGSGDIPIGKSSEQYFATTFDVTTFNLTIGDPIQWNPMTGDDLYILGTISGHWQDGDITKEMAKMKMAAFTYGARKMWTWTPPNPGGDDPATTMWGQTVAGVFLFKKAGVEQYILYSNRAFLTNATNNETLAFPLPAAGSFNIRVMADASGFTAVRAFDDGQQKTVEYQTGKVMINGIEAPPGISFAGNAMNLAPGSYFVYQNTFELTNGQSVTGEGIDLRNMHSDPDVFSGGGNAVWKVVAPTSNYLVRMDAFSGLTYLRDEKGYPNAVYLDGWCWKRYPEDPRGSWDPNTAMSLYRVGTSNVYEGTIYVLPWGGDFKLFAYPASNSEISMSIIGQKYFDLKAPITSMTDNIGIMLPVPSSPGAFYKVSVDLKDGFTFDKEHLDGGNYTIVPTNGKKFTVTFTPQ